eukprot:SAG11_NODE_3743_length_2254_cov_1.950812_3_plen_114_part_00
MFSFGIIRQQALTNRIVYRLPQMLVKKVRKQRNGDIKEAAAMMHLQMITKLEEEALMWELATGVAMEQHYDLRAHDDILAQIEKASLAESRLNSHAWLQHSLLIDGQQLSGLT